MFIINQPALLRATTSSKTRLLQDEIIYKTYLKELNNTIKF